MCSYCDSKSDAEIVREITDQVVPDEVLYCDHGWAAATRVWCKDGHVDDAVDDWIDLCGRRAKVLARIAVSAMHRQSRADRHIGRH